MIYGNPIQLGILGGGQLARMLCLEAHKMGIETHVLSPDKNDPAAQVTQYWHQGDLHRKKDLVKLMSQVSFVTFESEFLDPEILKNAVKTFKNKKKTPPRFYPKIQTMSLCQDRLPQKKTLVKYDLPTSPFQKVKILKDLEASIQELGLPLVLKKRYGGYDGYGTFILKTKKDLENIQPLLEKEERGFIAEKFIPFKKEVALIACRNSKGQVTVLPWVETHQENSRCLWVKGPISPKGARRIESKIKKMLEGLQYVGVMGIEFFVDQNENLLVNEIAPRVHNSGHYSQEALSCNQFQLHLKAVLGWELSKPSLLQPGFAMLNLLGNRNKENLTPRRHPQDTELHWYGKKQMRPGRKMGHLNTLSKSPESALKRLLKYKKEFNL